MSIPPGTYELGPQNARLLVDTRRSGAAAKAGHDLTLEVTAWKGTLRIGEEPSDTAVALQADGSSLRVRQGRGGMQKLDDDDKQNIQQTIDDEVLRSTSIDFRSTTVEGDPETGTLLVRGELGFAERANPIEFELKPGDDGRIAGRATIRQSDWGIEPYSTLFGALKVADEVEVTFDGKLSG